MHFFIEVSNLGLEKKDQETNPVFFFLSSYLKRVFKKIGFLKGFSRFFDRVFE